MANFRAFFLLVCLNLDIYKVVKAKGIFRLGVASQSNLIRNIYKDTCCDGKIDKCQSQCHMCMTVEVNVVTKNNLNQKLFRTFRVRLLDSAEHKNGTSHLIGGRDMYDIKVVSAVKQWSVKVKFYHHYNDSICHGFVEGFNKEYTIANHTKENHLLKGSLFNVSLETSFRCDYTWFGKECDISCTRHDDDFDGHYTCEPETGRKFCKKNYYGDKCTKYCRHQNNKNGHFRCDNNGEIICLEGWLDRRDRCRKPVLKNQSNQKCQFDTRWLEIVTSDSESGRSVWKSLKSTICKIVNRNCFGKEICPKNLQNGFLGIKDLLIYNASLNSNFISLRMDVRGNGRCIQLKKNCLNLNLLPSDDRIKIIITYIEPAPVVPQSNSHKLNNRNKTMLYSLLGLFFLVLLMVLLDKILKPRERIDTVRNILTPYVTKRSRL